LGTSAFYYDGKQFSGFSDRGINVAAVDPISHALLAPLDGFNTFNNPAEWGRLIDFVNRMPDRSVLMFAVEDEGGLTEGSRGGCGGTGYAPGSPDGDFCCQQLNGASVENGRKLLESLGSTQIRNYCYRNSWSMIAVKGVGRMDEVLTRSSFAKASWRP